MQAPLTITTSWRRRIFISASSSLINRVIGVKPVHLHPQNTSIGRPRKPAYDGSTAYNEAHSRRTKPLRDRILHGWGAGREGRSMVPLKRPRDDCSTPVPGTTESALGPSPSDIHRRPRRETSTFCNSATPHVVGIYSPRGLHRAQSRCLEVLS